jgi:hypothetical protein
MNQESLLDYIYERQLEKFPDQTREDTEKKLRGEIIELQQARRDYYNAQCPKNSEKVMFETADVIIMANRLYHDFQDEFAWMILDSMYNWEVAKYVDIKWQIVEKRDYKKLPDGTYQHCEKNKNN